MKISKLINLLSSVKEQYGDMECLYRTPGAIFFELDEEEIYPEETDLGFHRLVFDVKDIC